jgi:hypothetical protein
MVSPAPPSKRTLSGTTTGDFEYEHARLPQGPPAANAKFEMRKMTRFLMKNALLAGSYRLNVSMPVEYGERIAM